MVLPTCLLVSLLLLAPHSVAFRPAIEEDADLEIEERKSALEARKSLVQAHEHGPDEKGDALDDGPDEKGDGGLLAVQRSPDEAEALLTKAGFNLLYASEDKKEDMIAAVNMLDMIFDIMDTSSSDTSSDAVDDHEIDKTEFFAFFNKNLNTPENQPPNQIVVNEEVATMIFNKIAGLNPGESGADTTIDKDEFTQLMVMQANFRDVVFFLIHPNKNFNLEEPGTWADITMDMWNTFLARNSVTDELAEKYRTVFKAAAGGDEELSYEELDNALTLGKSFLQVSSPGISFVDLLVPA